MRLKDNDHKIRLRIFAMLLSVFFGISFCASVCATDDGFGFAYDVSDTYDTSSGQRAALGVLTVCSYDPELGKVSVAGTINHKVMTEAENCRVALFRIPAWRSVENAIYDSEPIADSAVSIRFDFAVECKSTSERLSMYAAALIYPDGSRALIAEPQYPTERSDRTVRPGFKGVSSGASSGATDVGAGIVMIDVYLDSLADGKRSGYLQTVDGMSFYFNREYVDELDRSIRSASAGGSSVAVRLLVSAENDRNELCYASSSAYGALYRGVVVSDEASALTVYAYLNFLCTRYNGGAFGRIEAFVLGFCADMPESYNFCASTGPMYYEIYARTLAMVGIAASKIGATLIVPVSDRCDEYGAPLFLDFAAGVGEYIECHTGFDILLMIDSTGNAYHITNEFFDRPIEGGDEDLYSEYPSAGKMSVSDNIETSESDDAAYVDENDENDSDAEYELVATTFEEGFIGADNLSLLPFYIQLLSQRCSSVDDGYMWCWTPGDDVSGSALSTLYAYCYAALAANGAYSFILRTDSERFTSVSHLVKYIDAGDFYDETSFVLELFGVSAWEDILPGFDEFELPLRIMTEATLVTDEPEHLGEYMLWDFGTASGAQGWSAGLGCDSLRTVYDSRDGCLKGVLDDRGGGVYSDICCICDPFETLNYTETIAIELSCSGGTDAPDSGELYEVKLMIYSDGATLEGRAVVSEGEKIVLYLDAASVMSGSGIESVKLAARRVSGTGDFVLRTYSIKLLSSRYSDRELGELISAARAAAKTENGTNPSLGNGTDKLFTALLLTGITAAMGVCVAITIAKREKRHK